MPKPVTNGTQHDTPLDFLQHPRFAPASDVSEVRIFLSWVVEVHRNWRKGLPTVGAGLCLKFSESSELAFLSKCSGLLIASFVFLHPETTLLIHPSLDLWTLPVFLGVGESFLSVALVIRALLLGGVFWHQNILDTPPILWPSNVE